MELPYYRCYKRVQAVKIKEIITPMYPDYGHRIIVPEDDNIEAFNVPLAYFQKHEPHCGGYYVRYKDGYESFSPAEQFESGYAMLTDENDPLGR
jgi:hypothetical protein